MAQRDWSLTRRMTLWIAAGTAAVVLTIATMSAIYMYRVASAELDTATETMLKDLRVRYRLQMENRPAADTPEVLTLCADSVAAETEHAIAWRIWNVAYLWVEKERGDTRLLSDAYPRNDVVRETRREPGNIRWRTEALQDGLNVGIVVDGSKRMERLRNYVLLAALLLVGSAGSGFLISWIFLRRTTSILQRVADEARRVREPAGTVDVDVSRAPVEIRAVVDALHELLANIQGATEKHRILYASMAHELRAPIQNLVGATEVALMAKRDADSYRKVLESNFDELRDLGDAIDNLMTICAPRASVTQQRAFEQFDLVEEAKLRLARERSNGERRGIGLRIRTGGDTRLEGDRESALRAVRNLVANAIEWSARGDTVDISIEGGDSSVVVTVDDCGPGVPPDQRAKIFDPFYRGPSAHGRRVGYGLGLAIVRDAAERHAGSIVVESSPAGGARFRLVLMRAAVSRALQEQSSGLPSPA